MKPSRDEIRNLLFNPADLGEAYVSYQEYIQKTPGVQFGVKKLDEYIIPPRAGQILVIVARPGNAKTTLSLAYARHTIDGIKQRKAHEKECVLYVSYDQPTEEIYSMYCASEGLSVSDYAWGRVSIDAVRQRAREKVLDPFYVIGRSVMNRGRAADLTFDNVFAAAENMESEYGVRPAMLIVDYIQSIIIPRREKRSDMVAEAVIQAKDLCKRLSCPFICLAQAGRQVDKSDNHIPGMADCQHASQIEQDATTVFGIMRPAVSMPGENYMTASVNGQQRSIPITENLLVLRVNKQRMTQAGKTFYLYLDPGVLKLEDAYLEHRDESTRSQ